MIGLKLFNPLRFCLESSTLIFLKFSPLFRSKLIIHYNIYVNKIFVISYLYHFRYAYRCINMNVHIIPFKYEFVWWIGDFFFFFNLSYFYLILKFIDYHMIWWNDRFLCIEIKPWLALQWDTHIAMVIIVEKVTSYWRINNK